MVATAEVGCRDPPARSGPEEMVVGDFEISRRSAIRWAVPQLPYVVTRARIHAKYAVRVTGLDPEPVSGVANVGTRPTVDGKHFVLEVHLFDFAADIYGHYIDVEFCQKLRDEKKFESFDALKQQIERDADQARRFFRE